MTTRHFDRCDHELQWHGRIAVSACEHCGTVDWFSQAGTIDPAEGLAYLFGSYDLIGELDALGAPSNRVLVYAAPNGRKRRNLAALPPYVWFKVSPHLWLSHDSVVLLLSTDQPLLMDNLTRGG